MTSQTGRRKLTQNKTKRNRSHLPTSELSGNVPGWDPTGREEHTPVACHHWYINCCAVIYRPCYETHQSYNRFLLTQRPFFPTFIYLLQFISALSDLSRCHHFISGQTHKMHVLKALRFISKHYLFDVSKPGPDTTCKLTPSFTSW